MDGTTQFFRIIIHKACHPEIQPGIFRNFPEQFFPGTASPINQDHLVIPGVFKQTKHPAIRPVESQLGEHEPDEQPQPAGEQQRQNSINDKNRSGIPRKSMNNDNAGQQHQK